MRGITLGLGIGCAALAVMPVILQSRLVYPTEDTKSAFIKSYNPQALIQQFACGNIIPMSTFGGGSGSAGVGFSHHDLGGTAYIEIDEEHWVPLMQALAADVQKQILLGGSDGGGSGKDMTSHFYYQDGRNLGTVTIPPLVPYDWITNNLDRHPGCTPVAVSVYVDEVFIPKLPLDPLDQLSRITNRADRNRREGGKQQ